MTHLDLFAALGIGLAVLLLTYNNRKKAEPAPVPTDPKNPLDWLIGPIYPNGQRLSVGVPEHPLWHREGMEIPIPYPNAGVGHVHYIERRVTEPLTGKTVMVFRGRMDCAPGVDLVPTKEQAPVPAMITLYLRRKGDNWSGKGGYEYFRWFCTSATIVPLKAGEIEIYARLDQVWTPAEGTENSKTRPKEFAEALANPECVGLVLGGGEGYGHGIYATGPASLVIYEHKVI